VRQRPCAMPPLATDWCENSYFPAMGRGPRTENLAVGQVIHATSISSGARKGQPLPSGEETSVSFRNHVLCAPYLYGI